MRQKLFQVYCLLSSLFGFVELRGETIASKETATGWTLERCIAYAIKTNLQVQQTIVNNNVNALNLEQSKAARLPSLNASASHTYNSGRTIDQYTNTFATSTVLSQNFYLASSLTLFNGFQKNNQVKANELNLQAGAYDIEKIKNDITLNVAAAYLQIVLNQELLEVAKAQLDLSQKQFVHTKQLFEAGTLAKGNLLDMQAQISLDELSLTTAQNQVDLAYLTLTQWMNLDSTRGFTIVPPAVASLGEAMPIADPEGIFTAAVKILPELKSTELKLQAEDKKIAIAKGAQYPQLNFDVSVGTGYSGLPQYVPGLIPSYATVPFVKQYEDNLNASFGFRLYVPLFNGLQTKTGIAKAKLSKINATIGLEQTKVQLKKTIQQAYADAQAALKKYISTEKTVTANQEAFLYSQEKYAIGASSVVELNLAKTKLFKAKSDVVQAKYEYIFKTKVLDFYQGKGMQ